MKKLSFLFFLLLATSGIAQTGTIQVFTQLDVKLYLNGRLVGKYGGHEAGYYLFNVPVGKATIKGMKDGYQTVETTIEVKENETTVVHLKLKKAPFYKGKILGAHLMVGSFGNFSTADSSVFSPICFGVSPFIQKEVGRDYSYFTIGGSFDFYWTKPKTADQLRMMINTNFRMNYIFRLFRRISISTEFSAGFSWWPKNNRSPYLSPSFNDHRIGWNAKGTIGTYVLITRKSMLTFNLGYMYNMTVSENSDWMHFRSVIFTFGPRISL